MILGTLEKYPIRRWLENCLLPVDLEGDFSDVFEAISGNNTTKARDLLRVENRESELICSLILQMEGKPFKALEILEDVTEKDFYVCHNLVRLYLSLSDIKKAEETIKKMNPGDDNMMAVVKNEGGRILWYKERYLEARNCFVEAMRIADLTGNLHLGWSTRNNLSLVESTLGNYDNAIKLLEESLVLTGDSQDREGMATVQLNFGEILKEMGDRDFAKKQFHLAIETISENMSDSALRIRQDCYVNLGDMDMLNGYIEGAEKNYNAALEEKPTDMQIIARAYIGKAKAQIEKNELHSALGSLDSAYESSKSIGSKKHEAETYMLKGQVYEKQGRLPEALQSYGLATFFFRNIGCIYETAQIEECVGTVYLKLGDKKHTLEHLNKAKEIFSGISPLFDFKDLNRKIDETERI